MVLNTELILDSSTSQNSTYIMSTYFVEQKRAVQNVFSSKTILHGEGELSVSSKNWLTLS